MPESSPIPPTRPIGTRDCTTSIIRFDRGLRDQTQNGQPRFIRRRRNDPQLAEREMEGFHRGNCVSREEATKAVYRDKRSWHGSRLAL